MFLGLWVTEKVLCLLLDVGFFLLLSKSGFE